MEDDLRALQKKVIPLPVWLTTRPCSALCVKPAPANRSLNHSPAMKNDYCRQRHAARSVEARSVTWVRTPPEQLELMRSVSGLYVKSTPFIGLLVASEPQLSPVHHCRHFLSVDKKFYILGADDFYVMTHFLKLTLPVKCDCGCFYTEQTGRNIRHRLE
jgi:hypothetical protein